MTDSKQDPQNTQDSKTQNSQDPKHQTKQSDQDELAEKLKKAQEEADEKKQAEENELNTEETLQEELEKMTTMAQRTMADFQNFKRRQAEEQKMLITTANMGIIKKLVPILDNFERAEADFTEGVKMCVDQFRTVLKNEGVEEINPEGEEFNPEMHEAVLQAAGENNKVLQVMEKGYKLGTRVIRHAKVQVGNGE